MSWHITDEQIVEWHAQWHEGKKNVAKRLRDAMKEVSLPESEEPSKAYYRDLKRACYDYMVSEERKTCTGGARPI
jgi:hypothetical protein